MTEDIGRTYGNTPRTLLKVTAIGLVTAAVVYAIFIIATAAQGGFGAIRHAFKWPVVAIPAGVGLILPFIGSHAPCERSAVQKDGVCPA